MAYKKSAYRMDFDQRLNFLRAEVRKANRFSEDHHDIRDMVFQCAIFQTSAAIESYLKLILESWVQEIKVRNLGNCLPDNLRGHLALRKFVTPFERYVATRDELAIAKALGGERDFWAVMTGSAVLPAYVKGADVHDGSSYPSYRNIHKLFWRIGIVNIHDKICSILKRDVETMIESFQSIRTALAHAAPPTVTLTDVRDRLDDMSQLIRAIDRILYKHINLHGGCVCWK